MASRGRATCMTCMFPRAIVGMVVAILVALTTPTRAQVASDGFGIERFRPAIDRAGVLDVEWGGVPEHLSWSAGVHVGFAHEPLVVYDAQMSAVAALVERRLTTTICGSIALWDRVQLGAAIDAIGYQSGSDASASPTMERLPVGGIGDARVVVKVLLSGDARFQLALLPALTVPLGSADGYLREAGVAFAPAIAASMRAGRLRGSVNAGYHMKPRVDTAGLVGDDEAFARVGIGVTIGPMRTPHAEAWWAMSSATPLGGAEPNQVALEVLAGAARQITPALDAFVGGGVGLDNGFGTPDWRAVAGVRFGIASGDRDGDGILGDADRCPDDAEDVDGFEDTDGCAELDNDRDGVADDKDRCPVDAEDNDRFADEDGCAELDNDGDNVADLQDRCPDQAEDVDGFLDADGCADAKSQLTGSVVDPEGRPIRGAAVAIAQLDAPGIAPIALVADDNGAFSTELDGGRLTITARAGEYKETARDVTVEPGTKGVVTVKLVRAIRQGQLRGQVLAFDGTPLAATVVVTSAKPPKGAPPEPVTVATDAEGHFTIELPEGAFSVEISSPGHVAQKRSVNIKLDGVTVLNVDLRAIK